MGCTSSVHQRGDSTLVFDSRPSGTSLSHSNDRDLTTTLSLSSHSLTMCTAQELEEKRVSFWESRVEGHAAMWLAIRGACEAELSNDRDHCLAILLGALRT